MQQRREPAFVGRLECLHAVTTQIFFVTSSIAANIVAA